MALYEQIAMAIAFASLLLSPMPWLLALFLTSLYSLVRTAAARRRLPPGPWPLPLVGNLLDIGGSNPHRSLARLAERYGPIMSVRLGVVQAVVVSSHSVARDIHQRRNADLAARPFVDAWHGSAHVGNSLIALPPGDKWRALRRFAVSELLAPRRLDELRPLRQEVVQELVRHVEHRANAAAAGGGGGGEAFAVREAVMEASLRILWRTMFSCDPPVGLAELVEEGAVVAGAPNVSDFFPALAAADLQGLRRRMRKLTTHAYGLFDELLAQRKVLREAGKARKGDLLDAVLDKEQAWQQDDNSLLDRDAIKGLMTDIVVAGTDSSTSTVEFALAELLQSPGSMAKVKQELRSVLGTKPQVEEPDVEKLPYLQAVVKETLRLHPAVPLAIYRAQAASEVHGYAVPEGATLIVNIWALQRRPEAWADDPERFSPERFEGRDDVGFFFGSSPELVPFSAGRRMCPGMLPAVRIVHLILASLLHRFEWRLPDGVGLGEEGGVDMTEKFGLVVSLATPLKAVVTLS